MASGDTYYWSNESSDGSLAVAWRKNNPISGTNEVPTAGAHLRFVAGKTPWTSGLVTGKTGSNAYDSLKVIGGPDGYHGSIGTASEFLIADFDGDVEYSGQGPMFKLNGTVAGDTTIRSTPNTPLPVILKGDMTVVVYQGNVYLGGAMTLNLKQFGGRTWVEEGVTYTSHLQNAGYCKTLETPLDIDLFGSALLENHGTDDCNNLQVDGPNAKLDTRKQANYISVTHRAGVISGKYCPYDIYLGDDDNSATPTGATYISAVGAVVENSAIGGSVTIANAAPIGGGGTKIEPGDDSQAPGRDSTLGGGL